jgi:MerR family copper efflux transcriptional regulator
MGRDGLLIGEVAKESGASRKALRLYEAAGILPAPRRTTAGYRVYGAGTLALLSFVRQAQRLGFSLENIKEIIAIRQGGRPPCTHVQRLLRHKAVELDRKLKDLLDMRRRIRQSLTAWTRRPATRATVCPHIERPAGRRRRRAREA